MRNHMCDRQSRGEYNFNPGTFCNQAEKSFQQLAAKVLQFISCYASRNLKSWGVHQGHQTCPGTSAGLPSNPALPLGSAASRDLEPGGPPVSITNNSFPGAKCPGTHVFSTSKKTPEIHIEPGTPLRTICGREKQNRACADPHRDV